jgi:MFS family permease
MTQPHTASRFRWFILLVMCITVGVQSGIRIAFSVFYVALRQQFEWRAATTASVFSVYMLVVAATSPVMGWLLDRYGPKFFFPIAAMWVGASLAYCGTIESLPQFFLGYGLLLPLGQTALTSGPVSAVISRWFPDMRGRAIALADMGTAIGMGVYSPCSQWLITTFGWRSAFYILGLSVVALLVPLNFCHRALPQINTLQANTLSGPQTPTTPPGSIPAALTLRQTLSSLPLWLLFTTLFFSSLSSQVFNVHLVAILVSVGISAITAATASGLANMISLAGRISSGWLTDRVGRARGYTVVLGCSMCGMAILFGMTVTRLIWLLLPFVLMYGLSKGSGGIIIAAKTADIFHSERIGTIFGIIHIASGLGGAIGPWWAGWLVDRTGHYSAAIASSLIIGMLAIASMWLLERRTEHKTQ